MISKPIFYLNNDTDLQYVAIMIKSGLFSKMYIFEDSDGLRCIQREFLPNKDGLTYIRPLQANKVQTVYMMHRNIEKVKEYILKVANE
jgi:hypothetical protein